MLLAVLVVVRWIEGKGRIDGNGRGRRGLHVVADVVLGRHGVVGVVNGGDGGERGEGNGVRVGHGRELGVEMLGWVIVRRIGVCCPGHGGHRFTGGLQSDCIYLNQGQKLTHVWYSILLSSAISLRV